METLIDLVEILIIGAWIIFSIFGTKIFRRKKQQKSQTEYPEYTQEEYRQEKQTDISEEERKLKEWLERVFGGAKEQRQPEPEYYEEEDEEEYEEVQPVYQQPQASFSSVPVTVATNSGPVIQQPDAYNKPRNSALGQYKLGKKQMAYAFVMSEIFQKPRALRPIYSTNKRKATL